MKPFNRYFLITVTTCLIFLLTACNLFGKDIAQTPTVTQPTETATETLQPTATSTATPTATPTVTPTAAPTRTSVTSLDDGSGVQNANYWQDTVTAFRELVRGQQVPDFFLDPEAPVTEEVFDPNRLLEPLTHLHMRPGFTLDFVYNLNHLGGNPFLYARKITDPRIENYEDLNFQGLDCDPELHPEDCNYFWFVEPDGSEEGYFEFVLLAGMGEQFYLYWHAYYNDLEIIASEDRLVELVNEIGSDDFGFPLTEQQKRDALQIDPTPQVIIGEEEVSVRIVWFSMWGGFYETTLIFNPDSPITFLDQPTINLVEYDCGIAF